MVGLPGCFILMRLSPSSCSWLTSCSCANSPLALNFCAKTKRASAQFKVPFAPIKSQTETLTNNNHSACVMLDSHLIFHADAWRVNHVITPVSLEDPILLVRQVDQLLAAALHVLV